MLIVNLASSSRTYQTAQYVLSRIIPWEIPVSRQSFWISLRSAGTPKRIWFALLKLIPLWTLYFGPRRVLHARLYGVFPERHMRYCIPWRRWNTNHVVINQLISCGSYVAYFMTVGINKRSLQVLSVISRTGLQKNAVI